MMRMALYSYWRSSCSWRVRIGLHLKGVPFEYRAVDLRQGAQFSDEHRARNPMAQVPVLEVEQGGKTHRISQSMAILEWLEERFPTPSLLPGADTDRARVRALAEVVNSGIQPFQNPPAQKWIKERMPGVEGEWVRHWVAKGLAALEPAVKEGAGRFCHGDAVTLADLYLVPQLYGARRFDVDLSPFPTLLRIESACRGLEPFRRAEPAAQPDAPQEEGRAPEISSPPP